MTFKDRLNRYIKSLHIKTCIIPGCKSTEINGLKDPLFRTCDMCYYKFVDSGALDIHLDFYEWLKQMLNPYGSGTIGHRYFLKD